ncbi:hypothetical protein RB653_003970 [Dictyostelium firmibasis]|uniref:Uroporphyrinogen decarboxylase n=1 Tax=Dictyostelium firmibasis TaxID=79012 RepID=A0AAN7U5M0_9MYCE
MSQENNDNKNNEFPELKNDTFLKACRGEEVPYVPVWIMRQAGRYLPEFKSVRADVDFFSVCRTPELACKVTLQPLDRFPLDAAIIFSDILVVPQAMGIEVQMIPGKGPFFPNPIRTIEDLSRVQFPVDVNKELGYVFDALTLTRKRLEGRVPLIGFTGAPWTLMTYCIEGSGGTTMSNSKSWLYKYPTESHKFLSMLTRVCIDYLFGQIKAGAQALQIFDSWSNELSPAMFKEYCLPYLVQIGKEIKAVHPEIPLICFAKGSNFALEDLSKSGAYDVLGIDWTIEPSVARQMVGERVSLQGNLDPCVLYCGDKVIRDQTQKMLESFGSTKRLIANLGHGMHPTHPIEGPESYVKAVHELSKQMINK